MTVEERKRENALRLAEDHIGRHLAESEMRQKLSMQLEQLRGSSGAL